MTYKKHVTRAAGISLLAAMALPLGATAHAVTIEPTPAATLTATSFTKEFVETLTVEQLSTVDAKVLSTLTKEQVEFFTVEQLGELTKTQAEAFTPEVVKALPQEDQDALAKAIKENVEPAVSPEAPVETPVVKSEEKAAVEATPEQKAEPVTSEKAEEKVAPKPEEAKVEAAPKAEATPKAEGKEEATKPEVKKPEVKGVNRTPKSAVAPKAADVVTMKPAATGSGSIAGRVYWDKNKNGRYDSGTDTVISGAVMTITDSSGTVRTATTDAMGNYRFGNLENREYTVTWNVKGVQGIYEASIDNREGQQKNSIIISVMDGQAISGSLGFSGTPTSSKAPTTTVMPVPGGSTKTTTKAPASTTGIKQTVTTQNTDNGTVQTVSSTTRNADGSVTTVTNTDPTINSGELNSTVDLGRVGLGLSMLMGAGAAITALARKRVKKVL